MGQVKRADSRRGVPFAAFDISSVFLTIPTAGYRSKSLANLIELSGFPPERIIVVRTRPDASIPNGCRVVDDFGPINIQRWWNAGFDEAKRSGGSAIVVANDDVMIDPSTIPALHQTMLRSGSTIASPTRSGAESGHYLSVTLPWRPVLVGCLFMVDLRAGIRADPLFRWWFGDYDLDIRARTEYRGVATTEIFFEHLNSGEATNATQQLLDLAEADRTKFELRHRRILVASRICEMSLTEMLRQLPRAAGRLLRRVVKSTRSRLVI